MALLLLFLDRGRSGSLRAKVVVSPMSNKQRLAAIPKLFFNHTTAPSTTPGADAPTFSRVCLRPIQVLICPCIRICSSHKPYPQIRRVTTSRSGLCQCPSTSGMSLYYSQCLPYGSSFYPSFTSDVFYDVEPEDSLGSRPQCRQLAIPSRGCRRFETVTVP